MNDIDLFNLEKIRQLTNPIELLQNNLANIDIKYKNFIDIKDYMSNNFPNEEIISQIDEISLIITNINKKLINITKENINIYLNFQDKLIKNYKETFKENLKKLKFSLNSKDIGLHLIENRSISKIVDETQYTSSISLNQWINLLDSLNRNKLFLKSINKVEIFYKNLINNRLKQELSKISEEIDPILIEDYKKTYINEEPLTFKEFLNNIETKLKKEELEQRKTIIEKTKEKERINSLKKEQRDQQKAYEDYLKYSPKEFQRRRRKSKRMKLSEITEKPKVLEKKEMSEEVLEKIEKFKSSMEHNFEEKYLIKRDDEKDPLDVVREIKKEKDEEYKTFSKKFKNKEL